MYPHTACKIIWNGISLIMSPRAEASFQMSFEVMEATYFFPGIRKLPESLYSALLIYWSLMGRLVPNLLQCLVKHLPLLEAKQAQAAEQKKAKAEKQDPAAAAAAAAQNRLAGKVPETLSWNLRKSLLKMTSFDNNVLTQSFDNKVLAPLLYR